MTGALRIAFDAELAFDHLVRAHILGQRFTGRHVRAHWEMWRLAAALFSRIWVPVGNTGRANVSAFAPMPVPHDLRALLENRGA